VKAVHRGTGLELGQISHIRLVARKGDRGGRGSIPIPLDHPIDFYFGAVYRRDDHEVVQARGGNPPRNHVFRAKQILWNQLVKTSILRGGPRILLVVVAARGHRNGLVRDNARARELKIFGYGRGVGLPGLQRNRHLVGAGRVQYTGRKSDHNRGIGLCRDHGNKAHRGFWSRIGRDNFRLISRQEGRSQCARPFSCDQVLVEYMIYPLRDHDVPIAAHKEGRSVHRLMRLGERNGPVGTPEIGDLTGKRQRLRDPLKQVDRLEVAAVRIEDHHFRIRKGGTQGDLLILVKPFRDGRQVKRRVKLPVQSRIGPQKD